MAIAPPPGKGSSSDVALYLQCPQKRLISNYTSLIRIKFGMLFKGNKILQDCPLAEG